MKILIDIYTPNFSKKKPEWTVYVSREDKTRETDWEPLVVIDNKTYSGKQLIDVITLLIK